MFLATAFAAGLLAPAGAHAALQGFSIDLGTPTDPLTLDWNAAGGLSAAAAPFNGKPAFRAQEQWILLHHAHRRLRGLRQSAARE
jgi:hypothetical protein